VDPVSIQVATSQGLECNTLYSQEFRFLHGGHGIVGDSDSFWELVLVTNIVGCE
jgi:hypothetical protein